MTVVFDGDSASTVQRLRKFTIQTGYKQINTLNQCTGIPRISAMFYWGSVPPEKVENRPLMYPLSIGMNKRLLN